MKLYEITEQYEAASRWLDEHADEIEAAGGEIPAELAALLDEIDDDFATKVERVGLVIRQMEAHAKVAESEAKRLTALKASYKSGADSLKAYCKLQMEKTGRLKVDGDLVRVWVQANGRPSIRPADPSNPPHKYLRVRISDVCSPEAYKNISEACEVVGVSPPQGLEEFDGEQAYEDLKAAALLPKEPGVYEIEGMRVERGSHLRTK